MMSNTIRIAIPNSVILVEDDLGGDIPSSMGGGLISTTESAIAIGCKAEDDGETEITLALTSSFSFPTPPQFDGVIPTPSKKVAVRSIHGDLLLELVVLHEVARIKVWTNDPIEPDRVFIGIEN